MSSVAYAEWTKVTENMRGDIAYVDFERIKKHDGKVYYWWIGDDLKPDEYGILSHRAYTEAECGRFRYRYLSATFFEGPMASGTIQSSIKIPEKEWRYPPPNSMGEGILKAVCNYKSMQ
jgi:hypothetical protein